MFSVYCCVYSESWGPYSTTDMWENIPTRVTRRKGMLLDLDSLRNKTFKLNGLITFIFKFLWSFHLKYYKKVTSPQQIFTGWHWVTRLVFKSMTVLRKKHLDFYPDYLLNQLRHLKITEYWNKTITVVLFIFKALNFVVFATSDCFV